MRIALSSYSGAGAWFILKLLSEGHSVDYFLSDAKYKGVLEGIVPPPKILDLDHRRSPDNYQAGLPDYEKYDLSIFDVTGRSRQSDYSWRCCPTIGDGSPHCFMEDDRVGGIKMMEDAGIKVPPYESFESIADGKAYVKKTGRRYVFKPSKPPSGQDQKTESTYVAKDAEDLLEYFEKLGELSKGASFILQEFVKGTECSVEGWFNGDDFYCLNATLEEKKFMNKNVGPNTGCAGNVVFTINPHARIYKEGLCKIKEQLRQWGFRGMIDLNTIVTEDSVYGLEWTPRFGYDASCTFAAMYAGDFGELLADVVKGQVPEQSWKAEYGASIRISIPPYPTEMMNPRHRGIPVKGININDEECVLKTFMYDVACEKNKLVVSGLDGFICSPIETGGSVTDAFDKLEDRIKCIQIPDMQYRTDIKETTTKRYVELDRMGYL